MAKEADLLVPVLIEFFYNFVNFFFAEFFAHCCHKMLEFLCRYIPVSILIEHSKSYVV